MRFAYVPVMALGLFACEAPSATVQLSGGQSNRSLANDYLIPAPNPLGVQHQGLTAGSGPKGEQILFIAYDSVGITRANNDGQPSSDDATHNKSWIPNTVAVGSTVTVPAFDATPYLSPTPTAQAVKDIITQQVKDWYAPYNVLVVTTRPALGDGVCPASGSCLYTMIVVGGQTTQVITGQADAVGVAGIDCGNDNQNNIGFAFSGSEPPQGTSAAAKQQAMLLVAQTIAHEAGHTFGLEHVNSPNPNATDIMSVAVDPNVQGFLSGAQPLVSAELPSDCKPGDTTEDTNARLTADPGAAPSGPVVAKPLVTWLAPIEGATVPRNFNAAISVQQPPSAGGTITKVDIVQAGVTDVEMTVAPYRSMFSAPTSLPDGSQIRFTAIAYNSLGGKASVAVDFTVSSSATQGPIPCLIDTDCQTDETCKSSACVPKPTTCSPPCGAGEVCQDDGTCLSTADMAGAMVTTPVPVGMSCSDSSQCGTDGVCASAKGTMYCTQACDPAAADSCPLNYECDAVGADHFCGPKGHGCEMSRSGSPPLAAVWLVFALLSLGVRRRLRASAT